MESKYLLTSMLWNKQTNKQKIIGLFSMENVTGNYQTSLQVNMQMSFVSVASWVFLYVC